jgi:hypothetical protein
MKKTEEIKAELSKLEGRIKGEVKAFIEENGECEVDIYVETRWHETDTVKKLISIRVRASVRI